MSDIPERCPKCDVPLKWTANSRIPGSPDEVGGPGYLLHYCPECKKTWKSRVGR